MCFRIWSSCLVILGGLVGASAVGQPASDPVRVPPGTIIFVVPNPQAVPPQVEGVFLTPDQYRQLLAVAEQGRRGAESQVEIPSVMRIRLFAIGDAVRVEAKYRVRTTQPRAAVSLGLQSARPVSAELEAGGTPTLLPPRDDQGLIAVLDSPGEHQLTVVAELLPPAVQGNRRSLEFGLPGSAVTLLEGVDLPNLARRVRVNGTPVPRKPPGESALALGPAKSAAIVWDLPARVVPGEPLYSVQATIDAKFEEVAMVTQARLVVSVLRGEVGEVRVTAPATAKVVPESSDDGISVEPPADPKKPVWVVRRPPSADDLVLQIRTQSSTARRPIPVPAFPVAGAASQRGTVSLTLPTKYRSVVAGKVELARLDDAMAGDSLRREAFAFGTTPPAGNLLDFDYQLARGELDVGVQHLVAWSEAGSRLTSRFELRPVRRETDRIEIEVPPEWSDLRWSPAEVVESVGPPREGPTGRIYSLRLAEPARKPVAIELQATTLAGIVLPLPRPFEIVERGGSVTVTAPPGVEVRGAMFDGELDRPLEPSRGGWSAQSQRGPQQVQIAAAATRSERNMTIVADLYLSDRQHRLTQSIRLAAPVKQLTVRGSPEPGLFVSLVDGGTLAPVGPGEWLVTPANVPGRESALRFELVLPRVPMDSGLTVPLLWPESTVACETTVRVWGTWAGLPTVRDPAWVEQAAPVSPDGPTWPALSVRSSKPGAPLRLSFDSGSSPTAVVERGFVICRGDSAGWKFSATYRVRAMQPGPLLIAAPPRSSDLSLRIGGRAVPIVEGDGCFEAPVPFDGAAHLIEIEGRWAPRRSISAIAPTILAASSAPVRWLVEPAPGDILLDVSQSFVPSIHWGWQSAGYGPGATWSADELYRWVGEARGAGVGLSAAASGTSPAENAVGWTVAPSLLVSAACSLAAVGLCLAAMGTRWTSSRAGLAIIAVAAVMIAGAIRPWLVGQLVLAAQPGLVVAPVVAWWATRSRRRSEPRQVFRQRASRRDQSTVAQPQVTG